MPSSQIVMAHDLQSKHANCQVQVGGVLAIYRDKVLLARRLSVGIAVQLMLLWLAYYFHIGNFGKMCDEHISSHI